MTKMWDERHLPVLRAIVDLTDEGTRHIQPELIAERTGLEESLVQLSISALAETSPPFFKFDDVTGIDDFGREFLRVFDPSERARYATGSWPLPGEQVADRIIAGLAKAADTESDQEKRGRLLTAASWLAGAGRDLLVEVAGSAISRSAGM